MVAKRESYLRTFGLVWEWLVRPSATIQEPTQRRQARLLASLLVVLIVLGIVADVIWLLVVPDAGLASEIVLAAVLALSAAYLLNRRGHYQQSAAITVMTPALFSVILVITRTVNTDVAISYAILGVLLSSIFLTLRATAVVAVGTIIGICVLLVAMPNLDIQAMLGALNLNAAGAALILLAAHHRNLMEKERQTTLIASEQKYRELMEQASDGIFIADAQGNYVEVNTRGYEMLGYTRDDLLRLRMGDLIPTGDLESAPLWMDALREGKPLVTERRLLRKDGTLLPVEIGARMLHDGRFQATVRDITRRNAAEASLRASEQRFRALVENSSDAIALFAEDGTILYGSPSTSRLLGYGLDEFTGRNAFELIHPDDHESVKERLMKSLAQPGVGISVQADVQHKDGRWRRLEGIFTNLLADPSIGAIVNNYRDITESEQAEAALRESEARYRKISELTSDYTYAFRVVEGTDAVLEWASDAVMRVTGYTAEELPTVARWDSMVYPDDVEKLKQQRRRMFAGEQPGEIEIRIIAKSGDIRWLSNHLLAEWAGERIVRVYGAARDISERKRAEAVKQESENRYRLLIEQAADGIFVADTEGRYLDANSKGCQMLGYSRDELLQLNVRDIVIEADVGLAPERIEALRSGATLLSERMMRRKHGVIFPTETSARMLPDGSIQSIVRDISERKRIEAELRLSEERYRIVSELMSDYAYMVRVLPGPGYSTQLEWVTGAFTQITGYSVEEAMAGLDWTSSIFPEDAPIVERRREKMLVGEKDVSEFRMIRKNGEVYWLRAYVYPQWDEAHLRVVRIYSAVQDITERKQAEEALRASEQRLRTVMENMPVMLDAFDEAGNLIVWNKECERVTGYSAAELIGDPHAMRQLYPDVNYLDRMLAEWKTRGNNYRNWEWDLVAKDGTIKTIAWSNISDELPVAGWPSWGVGVDVTERVRAEAALRRANEELERRVEERTAELSTANALLNQERNLLRALMDNIPDVIYVKDREGRFILSNVAAARLAGVATQEELYGTTVFDFFPEEMAAQYHADDQSVFQRGITLIEREEPAIDPKGNQKWFLTTKTPLLDHQGQLIGLVGISRDITERKQAEQTLAQERNLLRTLIDLLPETVFVKDTESRFLVANQGVAAVMGADSPEALLGKSDFDFYAREIATPFYEDEQQVIASGEPMLNKTEYNRNSLGEERWFLTTKAPFRNSDGEIIGIVGAGRDITERRQTEEKIRQLNEALAHRAQELEIANKELEAFTYSVSHDLRAPLRAMDGFSRIVMDDYAPQLPPDAQRYLQLVRDNAQQMGDLINGLLMLSRLGRQPLQTQPVAPAALARQAFDSLRLEMENRQVEITIAELPDAQADAALLRQVFANLLQNALKFTRKREITTIEVGHIVVDNQPIFYIKDNGVGFDMRYTDKLFGVFQRMHRAEDFEGTGIGLATVQRIIHRHGGRVWAEGEVDRGATFYFTLGAAEHAN